MLRGGLRAKDFLVAHSSAMQEVVRAVDGFADGGAPVLISGEHGTGRELVARVLHHKGPRTGKRFLAVRPSFEDAPGTDLAADACDRARHALRAADGGTLLVKDVSDLSAPAQKTLHRAMSGKQPDTGDVHVVATDDGDLEHGVAAKIIAPELYVLFQPRRIAVPPLRERLDDLPVLFERWVKHYAAEIGRAKPTIAGRALTRLAAYPWPGNVGELKSIARRLVVRTQASRAIEAGDVDEILPVVAARVPLEELAFEDLVKAKLAGLLARVDGYPVHDLYDKVVARVERPLFDLVLARTGGNQLKAAEMLGVNRNTLRKKLAALGLSRTGRNRADRALDGD